LFPLYQQSVRNPLVDRANDAASENFDRRSATTLEHPGGFLDRVRGILSRDENAASGLHALKMSEDFFSMKFAEHATQRNVDISTYIFQLEIASTKQHPA
jgi:hypothetical protein